LFLLSSFFDKQATTLTHPLKDVVGRVDTFLQLIYNALDPFVDTDRVLNAPTNDAWLNPWLQHLTRTLGVSYNFESTAKQIVIKDRKIDHVIITTKDQGEIKVSGDFYIFAIPVERMAPLINKEMLGVDQTLKNIQKLAPSVSWMNGLQIYLTEDVKISRGHVICSESTWALTCISQPQFWPSIDLTKYGTGRVKGVISIDISDWFTKGSNGKTAANSTKKEIFEETWHQLKASLNTKEHTILIDDMVVDWYLDSDIVETAKPYPSDVKPGNPEYSFNREPLLVNRVNTWALRPQAYTYIDNLFLASDYVKTNTDLATMEGANEAARRAVNAILQKSGVNAPECKIWDLYEPWFLAPFRWADRKKFKKGLPWHHKKNELTSVLIHITHFAARIVSFWKRKKIKKNRSNTV